MTSIPAEPGKASEDGTLYSRSGAACVTFIIGAVLVANLNALFADFVWDDRLLIIGNSSIKRLDNLSTLFSQPFLQVYYRPVVMLSFALEYALYGLRPWGFHLTNILLHAANAVLVFALLDRVARSRFVALAAALLFAVHPANKAVVAINDRTALLATFFLLSSLILYLRHRQCKTAASGLLHYAGSCVLFALGLFSKEEALTLPFLLILADWLIPREGRKPFSASRVAGYLPYFFLVAFFFWIRGHVIKADIGIVDAFMTEPARRLLTVPSILFDYLLTLLLPVRMNYDPRIPLADSLFQPAIFLSVLLLAALAALLPVLMARAKKEAFGTLWYFITFVPMCNIVPIYSEVADLELTTPIRYVYLPSIGFCFVAGLAFDRYVQRLKESDTGMQRSKAAVLAFCCVIFMFSVLSINRNTLWKDEALFYRYVMELNPGNHKMHFNLGTVYMQRGQLDAAVEELRQAITLAPDRAEYRNNLALAYKAKGWLDRAIDEYHHSLQLDPNSAKTYANLAAAYTARQQFAEAIAAGEEALELAPSSLTAQVNLAEAYRQAGGVEKAEELLRAAIRANPDSVEAHNALGILYASTERYALARGEWETALRLRPDDGDARENLRRLETMER